MGRFYGGVFVSHLLNIVLYVLQSQTVLIVYPCMVCLVASLFVLVCRLIKGNYHGIHI